MRRVEPRPGEGLVPLLDGIVVWMQESQYRQPLVRILHRVVAVVMKDVWESELHKCVVQKPLLRDSAPFYGGTRAVLDDARVLVPCVLLLQIVRDFDITNEIAQTAKLCCLE
jgi:hypothetical protein